ncbi:amino acid permease [Trueperella pyogenes]|uniref:amino acid permease n=1 Tax=Trueperella pyogenes TaxID=1661 RepID=UPI0006B2520C|nr:amino acid permease [Trueperella pyogenes]ALD73862.1 gamma-aminobutyrate permease [Trueperella pyogenes]MBB3024158.1 lysine-specific permease [Trueperella pyogenes]WHU56262.1 amino acid permease [Trueperella pyogenes]WHU59892.1 amino acid permease [Trueperella pyogenes]SUO86823.1 Lysine-specific permease [Trueperella pyogenes]
MTTQPNDRLHRGLRARHLNMIAIGGAIGTGLFVASGATISQAGPGGALLAYTLIGAMVFFLMQSLGEMATYSPVAGSFGDYGTHYVSPSFGFAMGWNYWFNWAITVAAELVAAALVMRYWFPNSPAILWSALFLAILFLINAFSARTFGEGEFWFASVKVATVLLFLVLGVLMILGIMGGPSPGTSNWTTGSAPFVNGGMGVLSVFMIAGFSFQGTEMVGIAAGEAEDPDRNIPRAIRAVFWRILIFYIAAIAVIGFLLPYTDPALLNPNGDIALSPFTLVFERAGVAAAAAIMNAVILTSVLSAGTSGLYASTRMLYGLAKSGQAPQIFASTTRRGIPMVALLATTLVGAASFLTSLIGDGSAYTWLVNASGLAGFITWAGIAWSHYKFRKAYVAQGNDPADLPFRAAFFPVGPLLALAMTLVVIIGQNTEALLGETGFTALLSSYIGLPIFLALWAGHKLVTRAPAVKPLEVDLTRRSDAD